jgi:hypothetical protein
LEAAVIQIAAWTDKVEMDLESAPFKTAFLDSITSFDLKTKQY